MYRRSLLLTTALTALAFGQALAATEFPSRFSPAPVKEAAPSAGKAEEPAKTEAPEAEPKTENAPPKHMLRLPPDMDPVEAAKKPAPLSPEEIELMRKANSSVPLPSDMKQEPPAPAAEDLSLAPVVTAPTEKTFKEALSYVYEHHPLLLAEREKVKSMDESVAVAVSDFRPTATADYAKGRERTNNNSGTWDYGDTSSKGLVVTQRLFSGFSGVEGLKAAKQRMKAARADLVALEQQLLFNAVVAYTDMVEKQSMLRLSQNNVDVLRKQRDAAQVRFDVGELTKTDVAQAESRLASAIAAEQQALGDMSIAKANYVRAIGVAPPDMLSMPKVPKALPKDIEEAMKSAEQANPVILAAKQREKAFASDIGVQRGGLLPRVNLQGTMRRSEGGNAFVNRYENDALTLNVSIPLYQSGSEWAKLRAARNNARQAKYETLDSLLAVQQDTTSAWQNYTTAESIILSTDKAAKAAELALEGVRQENEFGVRTVLDVLDAEQEYLDARVNLLRATRQHKIEAYRLLASVGRLTAAQLGLDVELYDAQENYDNVKYQLLGW